MTSQQPGRTARPTAAPSTTTYARDHAPEPGSREATAALTTQRLAPATPTATGEPGHPGAYRVGRRQLQALADHLDARDWSDLNLLAAHRYATTSQIARLHAHQHSTALSALRQASRRLRRLSEYGLIAHHERRIGGPLRGSAALVWYLRPPGWRLITPTGGPRQRTNAPSRTFLVHTLAVTEAHVLLHEAATAHGGTLLQVRTEPGCWRRWTQPGGRTRYLKPDLEVITRTADGDEDHWLLEVDLGTESPARLSSKCHDYQDHLDTGIEQDAHGYYPQVTWIMNDPERARTLATAIAQDPTLTTELFRVITTDQIRILLPEGP